MVHNWNLIKEYYDLMDQKILKEAKNEWAIDAYAWDTGLITMTPIERWFWSDIRKANAVLYPQYPAHGFFLDFANPVAKVGIECDGRDFHLDKEKDAKRDALLGKHGWMVYRISGSDCMKEFDEESNTPSASMEFIRHICNVHGISRFSQMRKAA
jgi:very-short-patch-repair endonuclease